MGLTSRVELQHFQDSKNHVPVLKKGFSVANFLPFSLSPRQNEDC